jgi:hypothetical protein
MRAARSRRLSGDGVITLLLSTLRSLCHLLFLCDSMGGGTAKLQCQCKGQGLEQF